MNADQCEMRPDLRGDLFSRHGGVGLSIPGLDSRRDRPVSLAKKSRMLIRLLFAFLVVFAPGAIRAQEVIDFESLPPDLPGWAAYGTDPENQRSYRVAAKWDVPFTITLDSDVFHTGSSSLKCEVSQDANEMSVAPPIIPATGAVEIRFFVRTAGIGGREGAFFVGEIDSEGKSAKGYSTGKIPSSDNDWVEVVWTGQLSPETEGVRLLFSYKPVPAGAKVWFDDISVKAAGN